MKYNQPYGVSDPEGAYINGNPATGTMGSIPPAASIEYPQRELINMIADSGLTPDNADLKQLTRAIQSGAINYCHTPSGIANATVATLTPPLLQVYTGMRIWVRRFNLGANTITNPTLTVPAGGAKFIKTRTGAALAIGDLPAGALMGFVYDGADFRVIGMVQSEINAGLFSTYTPSLFQGSFTMAGVVEDDPIKNISGISSWSSPTVFGGIVNLKGSGVSSTGLFTCAAADAGIWNFAMRAGTGAAGDEIMAEMNHAQGSGGNFGVASVYTLNGGPIANAYGMANMLAGHTIQFRIRCYASVGTTCTVSGTFAGARIGANV